MRATNVAFLLPVLLMLAGFLVYPLVYGIVLSLHDTQGFDLTSFVGLDHYVRPSSETPCSTGASSTRSCSPAPRSCCRPGSGCCWPCSSPTRGAAGRSSGRVLPAVRARPGGGRRGLEVPVRAVLRHRGDGGIGARLGHADLRAALGCGHCALGGHGRLPVALHRLHHGRVPRGHPGLPARVPRVRGRWRVPAGSSASGT